MNTLDYLKNYYSTHDEDSRLLSRHGSIEFLTTMRYIQKYLKKGNTVLEIGAGTGRYSHAIASMGYSVDAVELVPHNIELFKKNITPGEIVSITEGNATDLSAFADNTYDITLLLGPMYHLFTKEEQKKALSEAIRVTKENGVIFAAYCNNDATIISFYFCKRGRCDEHYRNLIDPITFKASSNPEEIFVLYRKEDVDELMTGFDVSRLHYVATDLATNFIRDTVDSMSDEEFEDYLNYHFAVCERADMVGATHHMLDVFRKTN